MAGGDKKKKVKDTKQKNHQNGVELLKKEKQRGKEEHPLSSFIFFPPKVDFAQKDPEEKVVLVLRKHPITNLRWILIAIGMLAAPYVLSYFPFLNFLPARFEMIAIVGWYLLTIAFIFEEFLGWFFNVYIITDERVFDVDFVNLIYREVTDANIDQIQDVTVQVGSVIRTVFNYGNIIIQTAAEIPQIEFLDVPQPDRVARVLRQLRVEEEVEKIEGRVR